EIESLAQELERQGLDARLIPIATASHSGLMEPLVGRLVARARAVQFTAPQIAMVSGVTGGWVREEVCDPEHWGRHLRRPVRFAAGAATLLGEPDHVFIEVGPGGHLASLLRNHPAAGPERLVVSAMAHPRAGR